MLYNNSYVNNDRLGLIFEDEQKRKQIIQVNKNELLMSVFKKYIYKSGERPKYIRFVHNSESLDPNMTVSQAGFVDGDKIIVLLGNDQKGGGGLGSMDFTDLSKQQYVQYTFSPNAPTYRTICKGLNICGDCKCRNCIAYKNEVIIPLEGVKRFDVVGESDILECPSCGSIISPKTVTFYLCRYRVIGKKYENDKIMPFEFVGLANDINSAQYYDPKENGQARVIELIIEILEYY